MQRSLASSQPQLFKTILRQPQHPPSYSLISWTPPNPIPSIYVAFSLSIFPHFSLLHPLPLNQTVITFSSYVNHFITFWSTFSKLPTLLSHFHILFPSQTLADFSPFTHWTPTFWSLYYRIHFSLIQCFLGSTYTTFSLHNFLKAPYISYPPPPSLLSLYLHSVS